MDGIDDVAWKRLLGGIQQGTRAGGGSGHGERRKMKGESLTRARGAAVANVTAKGEATIDDAEPPAAAREGGAIAEPALGAVDATVMTPTSTSSVTPTSGATPTSSPAGVPLDCSGTCLPAQFARTLGLGSWTCKCAV
jgi:hypothetical protein